MADGGFSVSTLGFDTFVLGVGAQKSGTTWVYDYLSKHPQCDMPMMKELHFFDTLFRSDIFNFDAQRNIIPRYERLRKLPGEKARRRVAQFDARMAVSGDFDRYLEFFQSLGANAKLSGDITPTYCALSAEQFRRIRDYLTGAGLKVRVIFLMRDPVARALSQARMTLAKSAPDMSEQEARRLVMRRLSAPANIARGRYDETVRNLQAAFEPDELFLEFFEEFFQEPVIRRMCAFLGIDYVEAALDQPPNPSRQTGFALTDAELARVYQVLRPVYDGCREIFGDRVPDSWMRG